MQKQKLVLHHVAPWVLTGSLIAFGAAADDLKKAVEKQQEVQKKVSDSSLSQKPDCPQDGKSAATMQKCIQAVCPIDATHTNYEKIRAQVDDKATKHFNSRLAGLQNVLQAWAGSKIDDTKTGLDALQKLLSSEQLKIDPKFQLLHNLMFLSAFEGDAVMTEQSSAEHFYIDPKLTSQKHPEVSKSDQEWLVKSLEGFYNVPDMKLLSILVRGGTSGENILKSKYPELSLKQALAKLADDLTRATAETVKIAGKLGIPPGVFATLMVPQGMIETARAGQMESEDELDAFLARSLSSLSFLSMVAHPDAYPWLSGRSPGAITELNKQELLSKRLREMQGYLKGEQFLDDFDTSLKSCVSSYALNAEALPTKLDIAEAKKRADSVIAAYRTKAFSKLSSHTALILEDKFKQIQIFYPRSFDAYKADFISELKNDTLKSKASLAYTRSHPGGFGAQIALFNVYSLLGSDWSASSSMQSNFDQCDRFALKDVNDRAQGSENVFWSSWFSVKNPQFGKAAMAHELGHIMDWTLSHGEVSAESAGKYQALHNCLKSKHPESVMNFQEQSITAEGQSFEYDLGIFNEEDFADQIAALVDPETNLGCLLVDSIDREQPSVLIRKQDTHSSNVFRALFSENIRKGKIPKVCHDALAGENMSRDFSTCLK